MNVIRTHDGDRIEAEGLYWCRALPQTEQTRYELWLRQPDGSLARDGWFVTEEGATQAEVDAFIANWISKVQARIGRSISGVTR